MTNGHLRGDAFKLEIWVIGSRLNSKRAHSFLSAEQRAETE